MAKIHRSDASQYTQNKPRPAAPMPEEEPHLPQETTKKPSPTKPRKKRSKSDWFYNIAMLVCLLVFLVSGGILAKRYFDDRQVESEFSDLQAMISTDTAATEETGESNSAKFAALRDQNSDFIGWISIEDTNLSFPVMFAPDNKDFICGMTSRRSTASTVCRTWTKKPRWAPTTRAKTWSSTATT